MYYVGIDLGGTNIAAGLVDDQGNIIHKDSVPTLSDREYPEIIYDMAMLTLKVIKDSGISIDDVKAIGVGSPGAPNCDEGILIYASNLKFRNVPIRAGIQKYVDLPVYLDNDANAAALGENMAGACKGAKHSVTVTLGTGIGGGIIINGKAYSGFNNAAAEIGHMVIVVDGEQCKCGRKGCWESYASATALIRQTKDAAVANPDSLINKLVNNDLSQINAKTAFDAAKQGDRTGQELVAKYIKYVAEGLANIINIFQPEIVAVGGGISREGEYLLKPLRELVRQRVYPLEGVPQTRITVAQLGNDAGIVGAAMLGKIM